MIAFASRESILNWAENVLRSFNLNEKERESIFHRFSTWFDLIMDKLFIEKQSITNEDDLKKWLLLFLLTYKFEGFLIGKVSIKNLVEAFLSSRSPKKEVNIIKEHRVSFSQLIIILYPLLFFLFQNFSLTE